MVRATAVLVSLALHTAAVLVAVALAAEVRLPPVLRPARPFGPLHFPVQQKARQASPEESHRAPAVSRGLRTQGRPQFGETLLVRADPKALPAARPSPPTDPSPLLGGSAPADAVSPPAAARGDVEGDSSRRGPRLPDPAQWSALLLMGAGRARAPAPSAFCVPRRPAMPEAAVEQDLSGRVVARYDVGVTGQASAVEFVNHPPEALAGAVRDWLRGCLFEPAQLNGRPVPVRQEQSFLFVLR